MGEQERVGIDVGGTFTDFVRLEGGRFIVYKVPTTPDDQSRAMTDGIRHLGVSASAAVAHGTTTATNALLERRGARCALVTTRGFRDVLVIGRQNRPHLYRLSQQRAAPLVPEELRFELTERIGADGRVVEPLDEQAVAALGEALRRLDVESVAIVFLFSFQRPDHERRTKDLLSSMLPNVQFSVSADILPEYREFERTATTVINAYVQPLVARYVERLDGAVAPRRLRIMQSNGGTIGAAPAARQPARLILSGPAGGVVGAFHVAGAALGGGAPSILTFDMGGTSTDVALCPGEIPRTPESEIAGLPLRLPSVDIETVGAGGGSIARVDAAGGLHVGPTSAGAVPGPACYGRGGTEATVTDADLLLGRLLPDRFLGGGFELCVDAARSAVDGVARRLGLSLVDAALGIVRIANASMERALRRVSIERGRDPKACTLVAFGGAGPLHACELADALAIERILVPPNPGVLSALGLLVADVVYDASVSVLRREADVAAYFAQLRDRVCEVLAGERAGEPVIGAEVDVRYRGQSYELTVPLDAPGLPASLNAAVERFHNDHRLRYGHARREAPVELVTLRVRGTLASPSIELPRDAVRRYDHPAPAATNRLVPADGSAVSVPVYERETLRFGHAFTGPAVVVQYDSTVYVPPGRRAEVDELGILHLTRC